MSIATVRDAIVEKLREAMPAFVAVEGLGGRYDATEVSRRATRMPSAHVVALAAPTVELVGGSVRASVRWGVFVACQDAAGPAPVKRDKLVLQLVSELLRVLLDPNWGTRTTDVRSEAIWSTELDKKGVALWSVVWEQYVEIEPLNLDELPAFETFAAEYDLAPADGTPEATDVVDLMEDE